MSEDARKVISEDWQFTPDGRFLSRKTGKVYTQQTWEVEVSYLYADKPEVLEVASEIVKKMEGRRSQLLADSAKSPH